MKRALRGHIVPAGNCFSQIKKALIKASREALALQRHMHFRFWVLLSSKCVALVTYIEREFVLCLTVGCSIKNIKIIFTQDDA